MRYVATIQPVHPDNTVCKHPVTDTGAPKDHTSTCSGRSGYIARCSGCSWRRTSKTEAQLEDLGDSHLRSHLRTAALATS
ncbi:hypothetical protein JK359_33475 [Streptomyces actinomycinicus]|uniref:Uncharacterized protein n=1 Tax=Streptomyces actinomycinicus TaxID=1695166 RepID=A0A937JTI8_9ACTN|nr:hypothetical protein [Streptomyces actinomycinicus]MBL1086818.1 hypothetical protein [Streptomyces actinomycinicus]